MKTLIEKNKLLELIGKTQTIVEKRNTMPILVNVLLEASADGLQVYATDLEVSLTDKVDCQVSEKGRLAVSARNLFEIAKKLSDKQPIQLTKKENNWLEIKQGKYTSKIVGMNPEDYPVFPNFNFNSSLSLKADELKQMINKTLYSVSTDETRYYLNGVFFEISANSELKMVATDGHRLSLFTFKKDKLKKIFSQGVIIPRKGLYEIKRLIEASDDDVEISVEGSQFILKQKNIVLMIRLIEGKYPNYQQFIPQKQSHVLQLNRFQFLDSLERVSLLANQKSKAVLLNVANNKLEISSNNPEMGDAREEIEVEYQGPELKIGFNARYIIDVLSHIEDDNINFELIDNVSPGVIKPSSSGDYTCVVMPMRI